MAIITISRGTMSGGKKLAEMLCHRLGYRCISREIIIKASEKYGVPEYKLFTAIQKGPGLLQRLSYQRERYLAYIQETLCELVKGDNVVYHGHAGHFLLQDISHVLKVRIVADMQYRIRATMEQRNLSEKDAMKYIEEVDRQRMKWTKFLYGVDWRSPELYDIVFNLKHADLEFVCSMIEYAVQSPCFQTTPESQKMMNDLVVSSRVKAALAGLPNVRLEHLIVNADDGVVTFSGKVKSKEIAEEIVKTSTSVEGVTDVINQIKIDFRYQGIDT
jgi:cytidylate kinase